jgi:hypothetical protein
MWEVSPHTCSPTQMTCASRTLFLRVYLLTMRVELLLKRSLELLVVRSMARTYRLEDDGSTRAATGFHGNIAEPFRYAYRRLFHLRPSTKQLPYVAASHSIALAHSTSSLCTLRRVLTGYRRLYGRTAPEISIKYSCHMLADKVTVFKQAAAGRIPSFRVGTCVRFDPRAVAQWLRST